MFLWVFLGKKPKSESNDVEFGEGDADSNDGDDHDEHHED